MATNHNILEKNRGQIVQVVAALLIDPATGEPVTPSGGGNTPSPNPPQDAALTAGTFTAWQGGKGTLFVGGTFGGATVTILARRGSSGAGLSIGTDAVFTAPGTCNFELPAGTGISFSVAGGTSPAVTVQAVAHAGA